MHVSQLINIFRDHTDTAQAASCPADREGMWESSRVWRTPIIPEAVAVGESVKDLGHNSETQASFFCKMQD